MTGNETIAVEELISQVDEAIMNEINNESSGLLLGLYLYLDTPNNPVSPREFLQFWKNLSLEEKATYLNPLSRTSVMLGVGIKDRIALFTIAGGIFKEDGLAWWEKEID